MKNNSWLKLKSDYNQVVDKIDILIQNSDEDEREFWNEAKSQLREAKIEAQKKVELLETGSGVTEYAQQEFEDISNDLNEMLLFIKEKFDLGDDNETGS